MSTLTATLTEDTDLADRTGLASYLGIDEAQLDNPSVLLATLAAEVNRGELLNESIADLELAAEDRGWQQIAYGIEQEFSRNGLANVTRNCRIMVIASPLMKRGVQLRIGYVWGQGVTVQARAGEDDEQDVNAVVQAWWDDPANQASFTGSQAQEDNERALATDGNVFLTCFTDPLTGGVQVRKAPFEEIQDVIRNPEDRGEPWFYLRSYSTTLIRAFQPASGPMTTRSREVIQRVLHPALGYRPQVRPQSIDGIPVQWDAPMLHVAVNRPDGWKWGIPDAYASVPWARAYDGFLTDWARLVKALSKFAWRLSSDRSGKARAAADKIRAQVPQLAAAGLAGVPGVPPLGGSGQVGGVAAMGPGTSLEAIPKTGATIDAESGKPLASLVAAGLGVSVVDLLADPGSTGARAVAETLDKPIILEMTMRRALWASVVQQLTSYTVDQAVIAPRGPLKGSMTRDSRGQQVVTLAGDVERTVTVDWPDLNELDPVQLVTALVAAEGTGLIPDEEMLRLLLNAVGVKDVDEVIEAAKDPETGEVITRDQRAATAGQAAVDAFRKGADAASAVA